MPSELVFEPATQFYRLRQREAVRCVSLYTRGLVSACFMYETERSKAFTCNNFTCNFPPFLVSTLPVNFPSRYRNILCASHEPVVTSALHKCCGYIWLFIQFSERLEYNVLENEYQHKSQT